MDIDVKSGEYHKVFCDNCGKEITKHNVRRYQRLLDGKVNFCSNKCKFEYWKKHGHYNKNRTLKNDDSTNSSLVGWKNRK